MLLLRTHRRYTMQAIVTRYLGPTNHRGSRVKAWCEAGSLTLPWDAALDPDGNHMAAASALFRQLGWDERSRLVGGTAPRNANVCNVYVMVRL
jgi:hypothetical protein